ncbi:MAG: hypothetical protein LBF89_03970 [Bacteroidales bacterium]|jgi:hypothetical protein|nr:hypothetical protein [Bacteroidales bacterium]
MTINSLSLSKLMKVALWGFPASSFAVREVSGVAHDRVKADNFILFPWGDMTGPADMPKGLLNCGYNATGFISARYVRYAVPFGIAAILYDKSNSSYSEATPQQARCLNPHTTGEWILN